MAPHARQIVTLYPISLAMEPLISHILVADSSAGKQMSKLNLLWLWRRHASICGLIEIDFTSVCSHAQTLRLLSPQWN